MKALCGLVLSQLPRPVTATRINDWEVVAPALLAHAARTMETLLDLQPPERHLQAQVLARTVAEHSILFAWLAACPSERVARWWDDSLVRRLVTIEQREKLANDPFYAAYPDIVAELNAPDWAPEDDAQEQANLAEGRRIRAERKAKWSGS